MANPYLLIIALAAGCSLQAANLPTLALPGTIGVNIHFNRGHEQDLDMIAAAGFRVVRMDLGWASIERKKGDYDWLAYDELTANLDRRGLRPLYILDYSNPLYEEKVATRNPITGQDQYDTASPRQPESIAAFARWAGAAAEHFRGRGIIWEIWNEPNISFWKPKPNVAEYNALALEACRAIRQADSHATIIGPATSEIPLEFIEKFLDSGVAQYLDAISAHPYRNYTKPPESAGEEYRKLRALIDRYSPKKKLPIISGEWGYASHRKGVSEEIQAAYLVRQQLFNLFQGIPVSIWYDWKNDGPDPNEREHNFGTVTSDLKPKPAYEALKLMTSELAGCKVARRINVENSEDYVLLFNGERGSTKLAAWTTSRPHLIALPAKVKRACGAKGTLWSQGRGALHIRRGISQDMSARIQSAHEASGALLAVEADHFEIGLPNTPLYVALEGITVSR